jgi:TPR repeat protein
MYQNAQGVEQDFAQALSWYRLAATQGNSDAQLNLGITYDQGFGVPQDLLEANKWYRLASEQGNASAQANLGVQYANGRGVSKDISLAHMWLNLAAAQGQSTAATNRDLLAKTMDAEKISRAQRLANKCKENGYKACHD